jgi:cysteine dioxygenase
MVLSENSPTQRRHSVLQQVLSRISFNETILKPYLHWDISKPYTRNRIRFFHGQYELLILCWNPGMGSKIHDHPGDGCYVRMLQGRLQETMYKLTDKTSNTMEVLKSGDVVAGEVTYITDDIGLHKLANPDSRIGAVSLHLYTPPTMKCMVCYPDR